MAFTKKAEGRRQEKAQFKKELYRDA